MRILSIDIGTTNFAYCIVDGDGNRILHWDVVNLHANSSSEAVTSMITMFWDRPYVYDVDMVVIESQDAAKSRMRRLSSAVQAHFETVRLLQSRKYNVYWSHGSLKLTVYKGPIAWKPIKAQSSYTANKRLAIEHTKALLNSDTTNNDFYQWFLKLKKQDDAADCFLQALYHLHVDQPIVEIQKRKVPRIQE